METIGSLGNVEIYFYLKPGGEEFTRALTGSLAPNLLGVWLNNWSKGKSTEVNFDLGLFDRQLDAEEEVVFRYQIESNYLSITLRKTMRVVEIYFRAWYFLDIELVTIIENLFKNYQIIIVGFELNFKWDGLDVKSILDSLKEDGSNYPFVVKQEETAIEIYVSDRFVENAPLLNFLKLKVHPVFEMIR